MATVEIPTDRLIQVAFAFRAKANEFYGAVVRHPNDEMVTVWSESAAWFDQEADKLHDALKSQEGK